MTLVEQVKQAGVVGAGGGGFPTHVKFAAKADFVIANGAECEPLLHKDAAVMEHQAAELVAGMLHVMQAVQAREGVIGIKAKNKAAISVAQRACQGKPVRVQLLGDYYPAGDEYDLVYAVTGRLIPPGGIPPHVGVVVNNVETLVNVAAAVRGQPVVHKTLTIAGAVQKPATITVPVGTRYRHCLDLAGGLTTQEPVLCLGGLMMGQTSLDLDAPVTKTTTGIVVLPREHPVIARKLRTSAAQNRIGKSACDQCRYCTEFCPRYLLGYAVEPHQVMRSLGFTATGAAYWNSWASLCCACGLCTLYACPEDLFPKEACDQAKVEMKKAGQKWSGSDRLKVHPMREGRRVPIKSLMRKLDLDRYNVPTPYLGLGTPPSELVLALKQGAGVPAQPVVKRGERVNINQVVAVVPEGAMGSVLHAPFAGTVSEINSDNLILRKNS
jgi:Na+-translocating ferredoxin:NAD+ oxidoreductase RnfC subunit